MSRTLDLPDAGGGGNSDIGSLKFGAESGCAAVN